MSAKSIILSIVSLVLYVGILVGMVFMFKVHFMLGIVGIALLFIPFKIQRKAINEASGKFDEIFAKYIIPVILVVALLFVILALTVWKR